MSAIAEIFRLYFDGYAEKFPNMPATHRKAANAIMNCRSGEFGSTVYRCEACNEVHYIPRSCGNRHCPVCQYQKSQIWLDKQLQRELPTHYFMLTYTLPEELREVVRSNQKVCYNAMFKASSESMKKLAADPRFIGADLVGFTGVLQTWDRTQGFHPHIHYIVPGGGVDKDTNRWKPSSEGFFVPVRALSPIFREKFRDEMIAAGLIDQINPVVWQKDWNVNCQPVGDAEASLKYLTPYVFRVGISDSRIVSVEDGFVTFKYWKKKSSRPRTMRLDVFEFIRRFLQHVLPDGFMKVRHYGFMSTNCSISIDKLRDIILAQTLDREIYLIDESKKKREPPAPRCPSCGGKLIYVRSIIPGRPTRPG